MYTQHKKWVFAIALLTLCLLFLPACDKDISFQASGETSNQFWDNLPTHPPMQLPAKNLEGIPAKFAGSIQVFSDDFDVENGQVIDDDVVVYSGDIKVKKNGVVKGNLVAYSGKVEIERSAIVEGDISAFSGDVKVEGVVEGDISAWSGDVKLDDSAYVQGDISILSGEFKRSSDAVVDGNIYNGPHLTLPALPAGLDFLSENNLDNGNVPVLPFPESNPDESHSDASAAETQVEFSAEYQPRSLFSRFIGFVGRLIGFGLLCLLITFLAASVMYTRPHIVEKLQTVMVAQTSHVFVVGFIANLLIILLATILRFTICLTPISILLMLALLALNIVGWSSTSLIIGRRIESSLQGSLNSAPLNPALVVAIGSLLSLAIFIPMFAFGGCLRVVAILGLLVISAPGVGSIVSPVLKLGDKRR